MQIYNNVMTVAKPKNKFFKMISLAKSNDYGFLTEYCIHAEYIYCRFSVV